MHVTRFANIDGFVFGSSVKGVGDQSFLSDLHTMRNQLSNAKGPKPFMNLCEGPSVTKEITL